ncbi:MAG: S9 family peptidase [Steroidobacteraceae bacterium]
MRMICFGLAVLSATLTSAVAIAGTATQPETAGVENKAPLTLEDLYSPVSLPDAAVSPSGRYLAFINRNEDEDQLFVLDLANGSSAAIIAMSRDKVVQKSDAYIISVYWKSDQRLIFRTRVVPDEDARTFTYTIQQYQKFGDRLFAIDRDGKNLLRLLQDNRDQGLVGTLDLGSIADLLPRDNQHILMIVNGDYGPSLMQVDIATGRGAVIEKPNAKIVSWWLDVDGKPVVQVQVSAGTVTYLRKLDDGNWKPFHKERLREMRERDSDYDAIGPADVAGKYYVLARPPGRDRRGVYLYDLGSESFGEPIIEHSQFDLESAHASADGKGIAWYCYLAHVRVCEFSDPRINAHMRGLRKFFSDRADVSVFDSSTDNKVFLLRVAGPADPPGFYYYQVEQKSIQPLGAFQGATIGKAMPSMQVIDYQARDGLALHGYLTMPPGADGLKNLPLVLFPHGGPEIRDHLAYDQWVQFMAARGYAVFQPNFRGSDGFGRAFSEKGYREWGGKMQDDLIDGLDALARTQRVDPRRVCVVGISYGGYAALMAAALTSERFKCAASVAGPTDLVEFINWRKRNWGDQSEGYKYWLKSIGNPETDTAKLEARSPVNLAADIKIPVLLMHGSEDFVVPVQQSRLMAKALTKAGNATELVEVKLETHPAWSDDNEKLALRTLDEFLRKHLGPGVGQPAGLQ